MCFQLFMGLLPDTPNCRLRMRRECRERFPRHRLQRKPLVSDPGMHHGTCVTHVPWCMSGSLTRSGGENVPGIPGACATHNIAYLARGPWVNVSSANQHHKYQHIHGWYRIANETRIYFAFTLFCMICNLIQCSLISFHKHDPTAFKRFVRHAHHKSYFQLNVVEY